MKDIDGIPVLNAKRSITLKITAADIDKADRKEPNDCAVARACKREFHAKEVRVHLGRIYVRVNQGSWARYMTPKSMRNEIIAFDRGGDFEPGEFHLAAPQPSKQTNKRQSRSMKVSKRGAKKKRTYHVITNVRTGVAA